MEDTYHDREIKCTGDGISGHHHPVKDQEIRQEAVMKAYHMLETLAYLDRQTVETRDAAKERTGGVSKLLSRKLYNAEVMMDSLHLKMVVVKEGKVVGEERLREKIGFLYGSILSYKGKPTDTQINGLDDLSKEIEKISRTISDFKTKVLPEINKSLINSEKEEIRIISKEDFAKEP
jgi:hypothetical protein